MIKKGTRYVFLALAAFVAVVPFLYLASNALKTSGETVTRVSPNPFSPEFWPQVPQWSNFATVWGADQFGAYLLHSVIISLVTLAGVLVSSVLAAYAFAKLKFPGKEGLFALLLATLMVPETVTLIPDFLIVKALGWINRLEAVTVPFMAGAFSIFLLRQFFRQIPRDLLDMAKIDGCSHLGVVRRIVVPLSWAPLATVAFLDVTNSWNALQWPLVVLQTSDWRPLSVGLARLISETGSDVPLRMAGAVLAIVPIFLAYLAAQKHITESITAYGLKQ
jgi:ABC-type glycerol-3-phosphate transport system permease component